jgi:hypothetical protein
MKLHSTDTEDVLTSKFKLGVAKVYETYFAGKAFNGENTTDSDPKAGRKTRQANSTKQEARIVWERTLDGLAIRNTGKEWAWRMGDSTL